MPAGGATAPATATGSRMEAIVFERGGARGACVRLSRSLRRTRPLGRLLSGWSFTCRLMQIAEHFISKASVIPASCLLCPPRGYVDGYVRGYVPLLGTTSRTERVRGRPVICIQQVAPAGGRAWPLSSLTSLPSVYTDTTVFRITRSLFSLHCARLRVVLSERMSTDASAQEMFP